MTAIIMKKGGRVEWAFTVTEAMELHNSGYQLVSYIRLDLRRVATLLDTGEVKIKAVAA